MPREFKKWVKGEDLTDNTEKIKVEGYIGEWYVIKTETYMSDKGTAEKLFLVEHEDYGDETAGLILDIKGNLIMDEVWNGFLDYEEREAGAE